VPNAGCRTTGPEAKELRPLVIRAFFARTVGRTAMFCSLGAYVCATDIFTDIAKEAGWVDSNQHAANISDLNSRNLCPDKKFKENCTFRHVDMNDIPKDVAEFDFAWSSCALGV
jgi:hypothetical protein